MGIPKVSKDGFRYYGNSNLRTTSREDKSRCIVSVADSTGWHFSQCSRKRGYGRDGLFCKQHAKTYKEV